MEDGKIYTEISEENRTTFEQNKREMFDGMRGYHASEHAHKRDVINFLKTVLAVMVGVYGAILGSLFTPEINFQHITLIVWGIVFLSAIVTFLVVISTNKKIYADHFVYKNFGAEYTRVSQILGLGSNVETKTGYIQAKIIDPLHPIGQGKGYRKTQNIISYTGVAIVLIGVMLAMVISGIDYNSVAKLTVEGSEASKHVADKVDNASLAVKK